MFNNISSFSLCLHIQNSIDPAETLVYADIGPSSLKQRSHVTLICDDDRVEYAQLNQNLLTVKSETKNPKIEPSSVGTYIHGAIIISYNVIVYSVLFQYCFCGYLSQVDTY